MNIKNKILYGIAYGFWFVLSLLPFRILFLLSDCLYFLVSKVVKYRHKVIWKNLKESFPDKTEAELRTIEKGFYHWFCDYIVETIKLMTMSPSTLRKRMKFTGMEKFNEVLDNGGSCAVYLGHYCNWEWITSLPYWLPEHVQCCELYHPLENEPMDHLFKKVRERQNALCIPMQEAQQQVDCRRLHCRPDAALVEHTPLDRLSSPRYACAYRCRTHCPPHQSSLLLRLYAPPQAWLL